MFRNGSTESLAREDAHWAAGLVSCKAAPGTTVGQLANVELESRIEVC